MTDRTAAVTTGMLYDGLALSVHFEWGDWVLGRLAKILVAMHRVHQRGCCYFVNLCATFSWSRRHYTECTSLSVRLSVCQFMHVVPVCNPWRQSCDCVTRYFLSSVLIKIRVQGHTVSSMRVPSGIVNYKRKRSICSRICWLKWSWVTKTSANMSKWYNDGQPLWNPIKTNEWRCYTNDHAWMTNKAHSSYVN